MLLNNDLIFIKETKYISKQSKFNLYSQIEIECQPQLIIDYKINFQGCKFLICFYSLSNELSNKSFIILFYILGC